MARRNLQLSDEGRRERAILEDPMAFVHEVYSPLAGHTFDVTLCRDLPVATWDLHDRAHRLIEEAFARGDAVAFEQAMGLLSDLTNNAMSTAHGNGMELGALFEQLRQGLCRVLGALDRGLTAFEQGDADRIARLRTEMLSRDPSDRSHAA